MNTFQNIQLFQESITKELDIIKNRLRNIIGNAHWGEDGRYKEAILIKTIRNYLPSNVSVGTGFIVAQKSLAGEIEVSPQMDILIYDNSIPVIFKEGDFVIITDDAIKGVIEVKTKVINNNGKDYSITKVIEKFEKLRTFDKFQNMELSNRPFVGLFSFDYEDNYNNLNVDTSISKSNGLVNHISLGPNYFIRFWENTLNLYPPIHYNRRCYIKYNLINLSFSYFISNLLHIVCNNDPEKRHWFSFPISGTKEIHRDENIIYL